MPEQYPLVNPAAPSPILPIPDDCDVVRVDLVKVDCFIRGSVVDDVDVKRYIRVTINAFEQISREGLLVAHRNDYIGFSFRQVSSHGLALSFS